MIVTSEVLVGIVALIQVAISVTEIFFWQIPKVYSRLNFTADDAKKAAPIVANAGLYNAFLAAGLIWGVLPASANHHIQLFFLICVFIAGIFGAATLKW